MSNQMQLQLAQPNSLVCDEPYFMITVPGSEGDVGVLYGHAPMATTIKVGTVEAYSDQTTVAKRWFVIGGFCEVVAERCTVMADQVLLIEDFNKDEIEAKIAELKAIRHINDEQEKELEIAEAKLQALSNAA